MRQALIAFLLFYTSVAYAADPPTRILVNGTVLTMDANDMTAEAVAIEDEKILAVGSTADIRKLAGPKTQIMDLGGRTVIPGLIDTHIHAIRGGQSYTLETFWYDATSLETALAKLKDAATKRGPNKWVIVAGSWSPSQFKENRAPTIDELNSLLPDNPVYIQYLYSYAIVNKKGLEVLALDRDGASIPGIEIEKDGQGHPTGKLIGNIGSFSGLLNKITASSDQDREDSLASFFKVLNSKGVTGLVDAAGGGSGGAVYDPLFALWNEGKLSLRVAYRVSAQTPGGEAAWFSNTVAYMPPHFGDSMLKFLGLGEILVFKSNDGTRYAPGFKVPADGQDELYKVAMLAAHRKYPLEIHAYTDDSASQILDVFERVAQTVDIRDLHWCIAHIYTGSPETFKRMAKLGICYTVQMGPYYDAPEISATDGEEVAKSSPPTKLAIEAGLKIVGGTDATRVGEYNTWRAIEYHITGRAVGGSLQRRNDFKLSRAQALHLYTSNAAWLTFDQNNRGTIEPGKYADLAVLDKAFMTMPAEQIHEVNSLLTVVGGKIVYAASPFK